MCNVSTDLIKYANSIRSENELIPRGKTLYVPCASVPANTQRTCTICGASMKLRAFVGIDDIAVLCNTTRDAIRQVNPQGVVLDTPGLGDTLMLPCNSSHAGCGPCGISYIVTDENESLQSVAVKCATMAEDIQSVNPDINFTQVVAVDTTLGIPCSLLDTVSRSGACAKCSEFLLRPENLLLRILFYTISQCFAEDNYYRSCGPCGVQYVVRKRSELLIDIARKCGYDVRTLQKYNVNASYSLEKGFVISLPCPLGLKATYHQNSAAEYVNQFKPFSSSPRLEEKITIPGSAQHQRVSRLATSITNIQDPGFIGCGICGEKYEPRIGDTVKSVAEYCNTTEDDLKETNINLTDENITSFQAINISCNGTDHINNCSRCGSSYHMEHDETLFNLAEKCDISHEVLEQANLGIDWNNVYPGQYINIPCMNPNLIIPLDHCGPCGIEYNAMEELGIENISKTCSVNMNNLMAFNPSLQGPNIASVPIGARLRLPCGQDSCGPCGSFFTTLDDQIGGVAVKCHVGTIALQLENEGVNFDPLQNNTSLRIPCNTDRIGNLACSKCSPIISVTNDTDAYGIANMCNVSIDLIMYANSIRFENEPIPRGKTLHLPCASVPANTQRTCTICGSSIKLKAFVKIDDLAVLCNTTRNAITEVNPQGFVLDNPGVGDNLMLPCNNSYSGCGPCGISYIVTYEKESLQSIAVKCATMAEDIQSANPQINFTQGVPVDTMLDIPCSILGMVAGSGTCVRCSEFLQRPPDILLRVLFYKPLMAFVFSIFIFIL
ncbi:hypothetical protein SUGI_0468890 [Cryptomeria japonica]|nr:hypothetical protein SUGI_0468890 [Cryptomeria japonica]